MVRQESNRYQHNTRQYSWSLPSDPLEACEMLRTRLTIQERNRWEDESPEYRAIRSWEEDFDV